MKILLSLAVALLLVLACRSTHPQAVAPTPLLSRPVPAPVTTHVYSMTGQIIHFEFTPLVSRATAYSRDVPFLPPAKIP